MEGKGRRRTGVRLEVPHDLLALSESLGLVAPVTPLPLAHVASLATADVFDAKVVHEFCACVEREATGAPAADVLARRGRLGRGRDGCRDARVDAVRVTVVTVRVVRVAHGFSSV